MTCEGVIGLRVQLGEIRGVVITAPRPPALPGRARAAGGPERARAAPRGCPAPPRPADPTPRCLPRLSAYSEGGGVRSRPRAP